MMDTFFKARIIMTNYIALCLMVNLIIIKVKHSSF